MPLTMHTIAAANGFGLVEVVRNGDINAPDPDEDSLTVICEPMNGKHGDCFVINASASNISYENVFNDITHVNMHSRNGIDTVGHTAPGNVAQFSGNFGVPWCDRFRAGMQTASKCIEESSWEHGVLLIDVPDDCEWVKALATVEEMGECTPPEGVTLILMRDDKPRVQEFTRDGQTCFMLSDRGVYTFTSSLKHAIASPLFPSANSGATFSRTALVSAFMQRVLGSKRKTAPQTEVFNYRAAGSIVKCADTSPMTCVTSDATTACDFSVGTTTGVRLQVPPNATFTVRAIVRFEDGAVENGPFMTNDDVTWALGVISALMGTDRDEARRTWAETSEPAAFARRQRLSGDVSDSLRKFMNMAIQDYQSRTMQPIPSGAVPAMARNCSVGTF